MTFQVTIMFVFLRVLATIFNFVGLFFLMTD